MTISNFRASEALYIVILRDRDAEQQLRDWAKSNNTQVTIENNRMKLFDHRSLTIFQMSWTGDQNNVIVWDTWNKRHIYL